MEHLFLIKEPILIVLTAIFFLLSIGQTIHTLMQSTQKESRLFAALLLYEVLIWFTYFWAAIQQPPRFKIMAKFSSGSRA